MLVHGSLRLSILRLALELLALVVPTSTSRDGERHLGVAPSEVDFQGDERESPLFDLPDEAPNLLSVEEELTRPFGIDVGAVGLFVGSDVEAVEPNLAALYACEGVTEGHLTGPKGLHLGSREHDSGFVGVQDLELVAGLAIPPDDSSAVLVAHVSSLMRILPGLSISAPAAPCTWSPPGRFLWTE